MVLHVPNVQLLIFQITVLILVHLKELQLLIVLQLQIVQLTVLNVMKATSYIMQLMIVRIFVVKMEVIHFRLQQVHLMLQYVNPYTYNFKIVKNMTKLTRYVKSVMEINICQMEFVVRKENFMIILIQLMNVKILLKMIV